MKTKLKILGLLLVSVLLLANCSDDDETNTPPKKKGVYIEMTTTKAVGEKIILWIKAEEADQAGIWIDLNNNGKKDSGEAVTTFDDNKLVEYKLKAQTITLYGKVTKLNCNSNQLTQLDVGKNTQLKRLMCNFNQLLQLDVSQNKQLTYLDCSYNKLTQLNINKNTQLIYLGCSKNQLTKLDVGKNTKLEDLRCSINLLTTLNVSKNTKLKELGCVKNQLSVLDISKNTALEKLDCSYNKLTQLDVSKNGALYLLWCNKNPKLTKLNVANGNNKNFKNAYYGDNPAFTAKDCPKLKCIKVDKGFNPDAQTGDNRWLKDATASYRNDGSECP